MMNRRTFMMPLVLTTGLVALGLQPDGSAAQTVNQDNGRPAVELVMFEQDACEWCDIWNEEVGIVYHKTREGKRAPLRRIDIHSSKPDDLKNLSPTVYTPTFVLIENRVEIGRIRGYPGEDFFWGMLEQLLKKLGK